MKRIPHKQRGSPTATSQFDKKVQRVIEGVKCVQKNQKKYCEIANVRSVRSFDPM